MTPAARLGHGYATDLGEQVEVLGRCLDAEARQLEQGRAMVAAAGHVRVLAVGSSRHAAGLGAAALEAAGVRADAPPAPGAGVPDPVLRPGDLLVAVSQSGETPSLVAAAARARRLGVPVISVTNAGGTLARDADLALHCHAGPERVVAATKSVTASVLLLRALAGPLPPDATAALCTAVRTVLDLDPARFVRGAHPTHVVAGGLGAEWVAAEVALKFAETGGRLPTSEPVVEHLHGPAAVPATTLALVHPDDPNAALLGGDVLRVGPHPSYDVTLPALDDPALAAVVSLVAGQVAALAWSRRLGVDADAPRGLSKVTRTA